MNNKSHYTSMTPKNFGKPCTVYWKLNVEVNVQEKYCRWEGKEFLKKNKFLQLNLSLGQLVAQAVMWETGFAWESYCKHQCICVYLYGLLYASIATNAVVPELFLITYHLWVPYCQHVPPCSRKSQCAKYN